MKIPLLILMNLCGNACRGVQKFVALVAGAVPGHNLRRRINRMGWDPEVPLPS